MTHQPGGKPKSKRIELLKDIFRQWGTLDKESIDQRMSAAMVCEADEIARALYRDLEELEGNHMIEATYYTRDWALIENFNPEEHKNFHKKWSLVSTTDKVTGSKYITNLGGEIYVPNLILNDVGLTEGKKDLQLKTRNLLFNIGHAFLCFKIDLSSVPITVLFARKKDSIDKKTTKLIEQALGIRASALLFPIASLSAIKDEKQLGHFAITIKDEYRIDVIDLGSSNRTRCYKLTMPDAEELKSKGSLLGDETVTSTWNSLSKETFKKIELKSMKAQEFPTPLVIEASERFRVLVI